jgi:CBS domain-containing membrane protein
MTMRAACQVSTFAGFQMRKKIERNLRLARVVIYKETLVDFNEHWWTFIGSFAGISLIGVLNSTFLELQDNLFLIGSFGASSVLIYGVINSPLAQPRNLIGGHILAAIIGVTITKFSPFALWFNAGMAVSLSIVVMQISKTLHPPGGATALIAVIGSRPIKELGYLYVLSPIMSGILILLVVALIANNITPKRSYPTNKHWYKLWRKRYLRGSHKYGN